VFEKSAYFHYHAHMEHLKNILSGACQVLVLDNGDGYVRPSRGDFRRDMTSLRADARRVATDLNRVVQQHGKQIYNRKG